MPTEAQAEDVQTLERQCREDFELACHRLLWIRPKESPLCKLQLLWPQQYVTRRYLVPAWQAKVPLGLLVVKTRRIFMTTLFVAWLYHKIRWFRGQNCYVLANDDPTLADVYGVAQRFHNNMPEDLRPPVDKNNTEVLGYAAPWDCALRARVAMHHSVGRGTTLHHILWDEGAFTPNPENVLVGFLEAVPRTSASSLIISSTANGEGTWFHHLWKTFSTGRRDLGGRRWQPVFLAAWQNPHNRLPGVAVPDLDDEERALVDAFGVDTAYLAWRRAGINEYEALFPGTGMRQWRQENPNSPTEAFQAALDCVFADEPMRRLRGHWRPPAEAYSLVQTGQWKQTLLPAHDGPRAYAALLKSQGRISSDTGVQDVPDQVIPRLFVWEPPQRGYEYAIGVDVGLGVHGDDSAVVVMRFPGWVTVAHYADNITAPKQFAYVVGAIADWYGRGSTSLPIVTVELNNAGILVNTELDTMAGDYQLQTYVWEFWDRVGGSQQSTKTGWLTTWQTKHLMVGAANSMLMSGSIHLASEAVWADMKTTYEVRPGVYRTRGSDLAMAWLLALVTTYRKFARFEWGRWLDPAKRTPLYPMEDGEERPEPYTERGERAYHDTRWLRLMQRQSDRATGVWGLDDVPVGVGR